MPNYLTFSLALALAGAPSIASAQIPPPPPPPEAKTQAAPYIIAAGQSDLYEINSSQVALQKSQDPAVRRFATMLIKHHRKTTAATMAAAGKAGAAPPPPMLDPAATRSITELQSAAAGDFDRLYIAQQVPAHQAALDLHQSYGAGGDQAPLRASAKKAVPIVKQHLAAAEALQNGGTHAKHPGM